MAAGHELFCFVFYSNKLRTGSDRVICEAMKKLVKDLDFYIEKGKWVFTEHYLRKRGYCCHHDCRHCPYQKKPAMNFQPGEYIWHAPDGDRPVNVTGLLGPGPDGRIYVAVAGSSTGIPLDECDKIKVAAKSNKPKPRPLF
jgi:hypothetical protein